MMHPTRALRGSALWLLAALFLALVSPGRGLAGYTPNPQEQAIADRMIHDPGQKRPSLKLDPILSRVARERAEDMAARNYFGHVNPDGHGPNYLVREAGYVLPAWWGTSPTDNFIESIAAGSSGADATYQQWMNSPPHRAHILAEDSFTQDQTAYGIGYAYSSGSTYKHYWVVITAPPSAAPANAALFIRQNVPGTMTAGRTYTVSVEFVNTGTQAWSESTLHRLAAQAPAHNSAWGQNRATLSGTVEPGETGVFTFVVTAPATSGPHDFQWQMIQEDSGFFGEMTPFITVIVDDASAPPPVPATPPPPAPAQTYTPTASSSSASSSSSSSSSKKKKKKKKKKSKRKKSKKKKKSSSSKK